jgi:hypothetical protein
VVTLGLGLVVQDAAILENRIDARNFELRPTLRALRLFSGHAAV